MPALLDEMPVDTPEDWTNTQRMILATAPDGEAALLRQLLSAAHGRIAVQDRQLATLGAELTALRQPGAKKPQAPSRRPQIRAVLLQRGGSATRQQIEEAMEAGTSLGTVLGDMVKDQQLRLEGEVYRFWDAAEGQATNGRAPEATAPAPAAPKRGRAKAAR